MSRSALFPRAAFDVVTIAASFGGQKALNTLLCGLPADFPAPIVVVCHLSPGSPMYLAANLARGTALSVKFAESGERLRAGTVYLAPPDRHLEINGAGECVLSDCARVNYSRPSADVLFSSIAAFGSGALALVLTGRLQDGAQGAYAIRASGGVVLAQEPADCSAPGMPLAAIAKSAVQISLPLAGLAAALISLVTVPGAREVLGLRRSA